MLSLHLGIKRQIKRVLLGDVRRFTVATFVTIAKQYQKQKIDQATANTVSKNIY